MYLRAKEMLAVSPHTPASFRELQYSTGRRGPAQRWFGRSGRGQHLPFFPWQEEISNVPLLMRRVGVEVL
jgi:hypothetical protein